MQYSARTTGTRTATTSSPIIIAPYQPLPWQLKPLRDKSRVMVLTGSAGGGKSRLAAEKIHAACKKYPGATVVALRKAREFAGKSIVPFLRETVIGDDPLVHWHKSDNMFSYANGSTLWIAGMKDEGQREALRSIGGDGGVDFFWAEEATAFVEADHNELLGRLRGKAAPWRQIIYTTNPGPPAHWIHRRLIVGGQASAYFSGAIDNPHNPPDYLDTLNSITGVQYQRLVLGKWVQAEGAVYEEWDDAVHMLDPFEIPADWRRFRAIDFGHTNPFVCQWWAMDSDGRLYRYREIYMTKRIVEDHARDIVQLSEGENIEATFADHDAEDRATLQRYGVSTRAADKEVITGIQAVQRRLRKSGDGKPRLFLLRGALVELDRSLETAHKPTCTEEEIGAYTWQAASDGKAAKEAPVKVDDHGCDTARYMVMGIDGGRPSPASLVDFA